MRTIAAALFLTALIVMVMFEAVVVYGGRIYP